MDYTLFPPIIESKMPAFLQNTSCKVYFSLSQYNNINQISNCQVTVIYQNNNNSALKISKYPSSIKLCNLSIDNNIMGDAKYYITIETSDLEDNVFDISQYYKIQIRFTSNQAESININNTSGIDSWLANNLQYFSEWSEICLIKAISQPLINMLNFGENNDYIQTFISNYYTVNFEGIVSFADPGDTQHVRSFNVLTYQNDVLIDTSQQIYTNPYNNINKLIYSTTVELKSNKTYQFKVNVTTNNFYSFFYFYTVAINDENIVDSMLKIKIEPDEYDGRMKIIVKNISNSGYHGNIIIKRASGKNNFNDWIDIHIDYIDTEKELNYIWYDPTIQSGQLYLYGVQEVFADGSKSKVSTCQEPKLVVFQHMYLSSGGRQLNIKFDPQIASFQRVVSEARVETIGSKYPWFYKSGAINYKTFQITGTISALMDDSFLMKASREDLYGDKKQWYDDYNESHRITPYNDYVYEKDFREEVMNFLYQNDIKLFRSATEGNIFVKLMDINFTPNTTLSRRIYSFSCTAYEADDFNIKNCLEKYNILNLGEIKTDITRTNKTDYYLKQLYAPNVQKKITYFGSNNLVPGLIKNQNIDKQLTGYTLSIDHLSYLKIELTSKPYPIEFNNGTPRKLTSKTTDAQYPSILGHIVYINGSPIIIRQDGIYELKSNIDSDELLITNVYFLDANQTGYINYIACIEQQPINNDTQVDSVFTYYDTIGQLWGEFNYYDSLYNKIYSKYDQSYIVDSAQFHTHLNKISQMMITAAPGTIFYVQQIQDTSPNKHVIGKSGTLIFNGQDTNINELYFGGIHLDKAPEGAESAKENEYIEFSLFIDNVNQITNPVFNGVYTLSSEVAGTIMQREFNRDQRFIYYKDNWYLFNQDDNITEIDCTDVIINYYATIYKGRV